MKRSPTTEETRAGEASGVLDRSLGRFYREAARLSWREPGRLAFFARTAVRQGQASKRRREWAGKGVQVPALLIMSVTRHCNLHCRGCFVQHHDPRGAAQLSDAEIERVFHEARDLGVSVVALGGGEPLTRPELLTVAGRYPELLFLVITNGTLIDDGILDALEKTPNVIPVVSLEGLGGETDARRGRGVYRRAVRAMGLMSDRGLFFGTSLMVTRSNFALVTGRAFVRGLVAQGCRLFFYVDYVPIQADTEHLVPSESQRRAEGLAMTLLRDEFPGLFLNSSASETAFGGCLAAGRGFVHVSAEGRLEPCPFAPYSDVDLRRASLQEALAPRS